MNDIREQVANILSVALECSVAVGDKVAIGAPTTWDSLKQVEIALLIEETFSIQLPPEKIAELSSQEKIVDYILSR